jgi:hypothetical protein
MSFPIFPAFRKLTLDDRDEYLRYYEQVEPYSDFSFNNLWVWFNLYHDLEISQHQQNLVLRYRNILEAGKKIYTLLGKQDCQATVEAVFAFQASQSEQQRLAMVPDCVVKDIQKTTLDHKILMQEDRANTDYILDVQATAALTGGRFAKLRRETNVFQTTYGNAVSLYKLDMQERANQQLLLDSLRRWQGNKDFAHNDPAHNELKVLRRRFAVASKVPTECLALAVNNKLVGFALYHFPPQKGTAIFNHLKGDYDYRFASSFMFYAAFKQVAGQGIVYGNFEQDLGIEGLRRHKEMLQPIGFLKRYELTPALT